LQFDSAEEEAEFAQLLEAVRAKHIPTDPVEEFFVQKLVSRFVPEELPHPTEEAVYNSLLRATTKTGRGHTIDGVPIDRTTKILTKFGAIKGRMTN
jgi:hypothetical protein